MGAYYNDNDAFCCSWLRELIKAGHLPPGDVDERPIQEVQGDDLEGYDQVHLFAGIGGWPYALRLAGLPDDVPVWTGSCPCQPYSQAGKGQGDDDPRNLWPHFRRLLSERRPAVVFGEQVASKAGRHWLTGVRADLEALGYAVGAADLCAAGLAAPHIRQRLFWVADSAGVELQGLAPAGPSAARGQDAGVVGGMADVPGERRRLPRRPEQPIPSEGKPPGRSGPCGLAESCRLRQPEHPERHGQPQDDSPDGHPQGAHADGHGDDCGVDDSSGQRAIDCRAPESQGDGEEDGVPRPAGPWSDFDLIPCADGKARRVESGSFPLAHGVPGRVGRLRGYGNAIVPPLAAEFVRAWKEA